MHRTVVPAMLLVALSASACGGSDDPGPQEPPPTTAAATTSTTPSAPTSSAAPAATGPALSLAHASVRIPDGWSKLDNSLYDQRDAGDDDSSSLISLGEIDAFGGQTDPDELGRSVIKTNPYPRDPQLLPAVVVDGVEMYHLAGKIHKNAYLEDFGAVVDDTIVSLSFTFSLEISPAERQQVVDSVLASYRWK